MVTAVGCWKPPMLTGVSVVAGVLPKSTPRFISVMVFEPVLATMAAPVASLMATPDGFLPVLTSGAASVPFVRSTTDAVPAVLLATMARPKGWLTAIPCGVAPTPTELSIVPNLPGFGPVPEGASAGLISTIEMLLQPLLETTAMGEKGPLTSWSAIATELGIVLVGLPLASVQILDMSTA